MKNVKNIFFLILILAIEIGLAYLLYVFAISSKIWYIIFALFIIMIILITLFTNKIIIDSKIKKKSEIMKGYFIVIKNILFVLIILFFTGIAASIIYIKFLI